MYEIARYGFIALVITFILLWLYIGIYIIKEISRLRNSTTNELRYFKFTRKYEKMDDSQYEALKRINDFCFGLLCVAFLFWPITLPFNTFIVRPISNGLKWLKNFNKAIDNR